MTIEEIKTLMSTSGYELTAHSGDLAVLYFRRQYSGITLRCEVDQVACAAEISHTCGVGVAVRMSTGAINLEHPDFSRFEQAIGQRARLLINAGFGR